MCERLPQIRAALGRFAAQFDPSLIDAREAVLVVRVAAAIEAGAAAVKALAAARAAEGGAWRGGGARSPADGLAADLGVGTSAARQLLTTGRRLAEQPELQAAAKAGSLSAEKVALVANAAEADPGAERRLIELAEESTLASLREECARVKASVGDAEERRRAVRAQRSLRAWTDVDGVWHLSANGNPEDGAQVMAALAPRIDARFRRARAAGERETLAAYAFDALVELGREAAAGDGEDDAGDTRSGEDDGGGDSGDERGLCAQGGEHADGCAASNGEKARDAGDVDGTGEVDGAGTPAPGATESLDPDDGAAGRSGVGRLRGGPPRDKGPADEAVSPRGSRRRSGRRRRGAPLKLLVRIDYDTWLRGVAREGETCELVGYGPIAVSAVRDLVESGDPFVAAILTKGRALVGVAHLGRRPNASQQSALQWLYPSCAVRGCTAQARLEADHRLDWATTHYTMFDLLDLLCHHHHALKTRENWALVAGSGKRDFVPPADSRHPRHAAARECA